MKQFKLLFSLIITASLFALAGCGSDGAEAVDIGTKIHELDKKIKLQGVVHSYRTGEALPEIEVRLFLNGKWVTSKAEHNGEYFFDEVFSSTQGHNDDNNLILTFVETRTKKLNGDGELVDGNDLYSNGTDFPSYPDSRIHITVLDPEHLEGIVNPNEDSLLFNDDDSLELGTPFKPDIVIEANTIVTQDIRLVPAGTLTGTILNADDATPVGDATVTIDADALIGAGAAGNDDQIAGWDNSIIHALSAADGSVVFSSATGNPAPGIDYNSLPVGSQIHSEAIGFNDKDIDMVVSANADIKDDLVGRFGTVLMAPFTIDMITFRLTVLDENFAALPGAVVTVTPNKSTADGAAYDTALAQDLVSVLEYTATTDVAGQVTLTVPAFLYNGTKDFQVTYSDGSTTIYCIKLDGFSILESTVTDLDVDLKDDKDSKDIVDLGQICIGPKVIEFCSSFIFQIVYNDLPVSGVVVSGYYVSNLDGVATEPITRTFATVTSDANGFVTLLDIPVDDFDVAEVEGAEFIRFNLDFSAAASNFANLVGKKLVIATSSAAVEADEVSLTADNAGGDFAAPLAAIGECGLAAQVTLKALDTKLNSLSGYIVEGLEGNSFQVLSGINLALVVKAAGQIDKTYFASTDANGFYTFTAANGVNIPLDTNINELSLTVLGGVYEFLGDDNKIVLDDVVGAQNNIDQIDSDLATDVNDNRWLWQLDEVVANQIAGKYDGADLVVHTASIEDPSTVNQTGFHVVTTLKSVAGVDTFAVIEKSVGSDFAAPAGDDIVYTFTTAANEGSALRIVMSGDVDATKTWDYRNVGANDPDDNTLNRIYIDNFDATPVSGDGQADGDVLTYTAVVGVNARFIDITLAGNGNKFEIGVNYRALVRVWDVNGNVSDDTIIFRFYDDNAKNFSQPLADFDVNEMSNGRDWRLSNANQNLVVVSDDGDAEFVVYSTSFASAGLGSVQSERIALGNLKLRFAIPTDLSTGVTADTTDVDVKDAIEDAGAINGGFEVWAQAYTTAGVITQHWTEVTTDLANVDKAIFDAEYAGFGTIGADLGTDPIFNETLVAGNLIDIAIVHTNSQIDPTAANVFTLGGLPAASNAQLVGVQVKSVNWAGGASPFTVEVTLNEETSADATSVPVITSSLADFAFTAGTYPNTGDVFEVTANFTVPGATLTTADSGDTDIANDIIIIGNNVYAQGFSAANAAAFRVGYDATYTDGNNDNPPAATNLTDRNITQVDSFEIAMTINTADIDNGFAVPAAFDENTPGGNAYALNDDSTTTLVDVDLTGQINDTGVDEPAGDPLMTGATLWYTALNPGKLRTLLVSLVFGDIVFVNGADAYLIIQTNNGTGTITFNTGGLEADLVADLGYEGGAAKTLDIATKIILGGGAPVLDGDDAGSLSLDDADGFNPRGSFDDVSSMVNGTTDWIQITGDHDLVEGDLIYVTTSPTPAGQVSTFSTFVLSSIVIGADTFVEVQTSTVAPSPLTLLSGSAVNLTTDPVRDVAFLGDTVTVTDLGTGVVSKESGQALNTSGDESAINNGTNDLNFRNEGGLGYNSVR